MYNREHYKPVVIKTETSKWEKVAELVFCIVVGVGIAYGSFLYLSL